MKQNIGNRITIKTERQNLYSDIIRTAINGGRISFRCLSEKDAVKIISELGRIPEYHKKIDVEKLEEAEKYFEPMNNPWAKKAVYASLSNDLDRAIEYAKKAIESDPNEPAFHKILSTLYYKNGKMADSLKETLIVEKLSDAKTLSKYPGTYLGIAKIYAQLKEDDKAMTYIDKVLSTNSRNVIARLQIADIYEEMGKYNLAIKEYKILSESDDEHVQEKGTEGFERVKEKMRSMGNRDNPIIPCQD